MDGVRDNVQTQVVGEARMRAFGDVLAEGVRVAEDEGVPYLIGGSIASGVWGRPGSIGDVDMMISPTEAKRLLKAFERAGFATHVHDPQWLYKAVKDGVTVDLIFQMEGSLYVEDEMVERGPIRDVHGVRLRVMSPEDFLVSQALSAKEDTPEYWYNGLGVIPRAELDWEYLLERAMRGPRRVLSMLVYAQSDDLPVPDPIVRRLFDATFGESG